MAKKLDLTDAAAALGDSDRMAVVQGTVSVTNEDADGSIKRSLLSALWTYILAKIGTAASSVRTNLGLGTGDSPQFTAVNIGAATDTTVTRGSAGHLAVEGATVWDSGNDGAGSGLDADLLDGANLSTDGTFAGNSDTLIPSQKAVKTYADQIIAAGDAMVFKGVIDCSANPNYPAANRGDTYRVSVAGKIGGASGTNVEAGDLLICLTDGTASGTQAAVGSAWTITQTNLDGAVIGPASVTDDLPAVFDGTTGKLVKQKTYAAFKTLLVLVKGDVGLGNVDNTADSAKSIATTQLTGALQAAQEPAHTGDVTNTAGSLALTIANAAVSLAKMANMATASLIYRRTAGTGVPEVNTLAQLKTDLVLVKGDVGLGNVDNTADTAKPVSTAQQTALDLKANIASPTFTGTVTLPADPASALQAATKQYVDGLAANVGKRARIRAATTANITIATALNNGDVLDGVTLATGDQVLVKNQTAPAENGVYVVGVSPARAPEFDTYDEHPGSLIAVQEGTVNADTVWLCTSNVGGTLNTTSIVFAAFTAVGGSGDVVGPASVTDDLPAIFDGTTGKLIKQKTYAAFKTLLVLVKGDVGLGNVDNTSDATKFTSPALTGTPTAPTAAPGTNTTQISTTAFVKAAIDVVLGGVSAAFDTLSEIATDLGLKMVKTANLSDVANAATSFGNIKQDATTTATGVSELATTTEALTGTDAARTVSPDALAALWEKGADVASAGTISLGEGGYFHITGTTGITDIDFATAKDGRWAWLIFDGAVTITHNGTTLNIAGGANWTTAANDRALVIQDNSDNVYLIPFKQTGKATIGPAAADVTDSTATGRSILTAANAAAVATAAGVGAGDSPTHVALTLSNGQIVFPASQVASAGANTLDDYEEGTFTPAYSATGCTFSYGTQTGFYTKIGNSILWSLTLALAASGNTLAANLLTMTGLPFSSATPPPVTIQWHATATAYVNAVGLVQGTTVIMRAITAAGTSSAIQVNADAFLHPTNQTTVRMQGLSTT